MQPPAVACVLHGSEMGGISESVFALAESFRQGPVRMLVVILKRTRLVDEAIGRGLDVVVCPCRWGLDPVGIWQLRSLLRRKRVNVLHAYSAMACVTSALTARVTPRLRFVASVRADVEQESKSAFSSAWRRRCLLTLYRFALAKADRVVTNSVAMKQWAAARGVKTSRISVIYNGLDLETIDRRLAGTDRNPAAVAKPATAVIGTVGRLTPIKSHETLMQAGRILAAEVPELRIILVGDGKQRTHLEQLCRQWKLQGHVEFAGWQSDVYAYIPRMDVFVLTSLSESNPRALLQAMACRTPVVATRVGGIPEIIEDGVNGLLVPPASPRELAAAVLRLLRDEGLRKRLGEAGRTCVEQRFRLARQWRETSDLYESIVSDGI